MRSNNISRLTISTLILLVIGCCAYILLPGTDSITKGTTTYLAQMESDFVVWMLICAILVLFMQAGFLLLEAGVVRSKNSINVAQKNASDFVICGVIFFLFGFQLTFGVGTSPFFGFGGIDPMEGNASALVVMIYQFGFCATAATIVSGAVAERMKFGIYLCLAIFMAAFIYPLFAHLVWGNAILPNNPAYLADKGFIDFAGSTVVHSTAAWISLAAILVLGARKGRFDENGKPVAISGHSSVLAFMGTIILLIGWIGFNAGAVKPQAPELPQIVANTIVAASFGATAGMIIGYVVDKGLFKPMATIIGLLGGLVAVTAGVSVISISGAALIGMAGGIVAIVGSYVMANVFKLDDPLDVVPVHGMAGISGTLLLVALGDSTQMVNNSRVDQLFVQLEGIGINFLWSFGLGYIFLKTAHSIWGIRVSEAEEVQGLNVSEHGVSFSTDQLRMAIEKTLEAPDNASSEHILKNYHIDIEQGDETAEIATAFNAILDKHTNTIVKLDQMTKEAKASNEAKSEFLANMSHEIRTPMNGVMGMAEVLEKTNLDERQKSFVAIIRDSAASLLAIINDILDFSKIEAGKLKLNKTSFDLQKSIGEITQMLASRITAKNLEMIVRIQPDLPQNFIGDTTRIRQILVNLIGNAIKFTEHGHILIEVKGETDGDNNCKLKFSIKDTGIGIKEDKLQKVFEKFSQVDGSSIREHDGTGLGLAITARLIALMDGEIGVSSDFGKGSDFWFDITLERDKNFKKVQPVITSLQNKRILVVDDNIVNQEILEEQLLLWKTESASCNNGAEALAFLKACDRNNIPIDAMILDYHMPKMNGLELLREIRDINKFASTPIMLLTSVDYIEEAQPTSYLGLQAVLHKPALAHDIYTKLTHILEADQTSVFGDTKAIEQIEDTPALDNAQTNAPAQTSTSHAENIFKAALKDDDLSKRAEPFSKKMSTVNTNSMSNSEIDVLIAEDNEVNQVVYAEALRGTGLKYRIVSNGEDAVSLFEKIKPTVICMDVSMPVMNGLTATGLIRKLEAHNNTTRTPIIAITAHALDGDRERCIEAGMDDYISKPISNEALVSKIMSWQSSGAAANIG